jgi:hypothetical protein
MAQVIVRAFRFHSQQELALYKKEGKEKGMFEFGKVPMKAEMEDKTIVPVLKVLAEEHLKGTILKAFRKNDNGDWDYCSEVEGKAKGEWGGEQTAEAKAAGVQAESEEEMVPA